MLITKLNDIPVMFVKIGASYPECKDLPDDKQEEAIYQCARGAWKIGKNVQKHLDKIQYVFALYNSIVVGIYPVDKNSWIARKDITADYDFPEYPFKIRKIEREYTVAFAKCNDVESRKFVMLVDWISMNLNKYLITKILSHGQKECSLKVQMIKTYLKMFLLF